MIEVPTTNHDSKIHDQIIREAEETTEIIEMIVITEAVVVEHIITEVVEDPGEDSKEEAVIETTEIEGMTEAGLGIAAGRIAEVETGIL